MGNLVGVVGSNVVDPISVVSGNTTLTIEPLGVTTTDASIVTSLSIILIVSPDVYQSPGFTGCTAVTIPTGSIAPQYPDPPDNTITLVIIPFSITGSATAPDP